MRGVLTDKIQEIAKEYLGREITTKELRLYPFIDYSIKNGGIMLPSKLDREEIDIMTDYGTNRIEWSWNGQVAISKDFYDYIQKVLWESYVEFKTRIEE